MALAFAINTSGAGVRYNLVDGDDLFVASAIDIGSTDSLGVQGTGSFHEVTVAGRVAGAGGGILLGNQPEADFGNRVVVTASGVVASVAEAIEIAALSSHVVNDGIVTGRWGIYIGAIGPSVSTIVNTGLISAETAAIERRAGSTETLVVTNYGRIIADGTGLGEGFAFNDAGTTAREVILNRGDLYGLVSLGGGDDQYDGIGGRVTGPILGGAGNDSFLPGSGAEVIDGGTGTDVLDFRSGGGLRLALDGAFGATGRAAGDSYTAIETVIGSLAGADSLRGDGALNRLRGMGGDDTLSGSGGNDLLTGGTGADRLTGGRGNDRFVFDTAAEARDRITDFTNLAGNDDALRISAAGFGGGLVAGALDPDQFRARASNQALDADDRFIFRTTDLSLWFDVDGSGAAAPVLIADLQSTASFSIADIILF